jgi:hypothetical protein
MLALAIMETEALKGWPGYAKALLDFPGDPRPGMEHRFLLRIAKMSRAGPRSSCRIVRVMRGERSALITEQRYYVSQTYICRFIVSECFEVPGGTLMFLRQPVFTDQVAGVRQQPEACHRSPEDARQGSSTT